MEVVLPTGELVRVGSCAVQKDAWHSVLPLPQLDGLFKGWLGSSGVVTKLGINVHPLPPVQKTFTVSTATVEDMYSYMLNLSNYEICDDLTAVTWWLAQVPIPSPFKPMPAERRRVVLLREHELVHREGRERLVRRSGRRSWLRNRRRTPR